MTSEEMMNKNSVCVSHEQAKKEIENHYLLFSDFVNEKGDKKEYTSHEILVWLGY